MKECLDRLPKDTIIVILGYLSDFELFTVTQVSKEWEFSVLARSDFFWKRFYSRFVTEVFQVKNLSWLENRRHNSISSYFEKCRHAKKCCFGKFGYVYVPKYDFHIMKPKSYLLEDKELQMKHSSRDFKVIFMGDGNGGKTSLMRRFVYDTYEERKEYNSVCQHKVVRIRFNDRILGIHTWDEGPSDDNLSIFSYKEVDVAVICFDMSNRNTLADPVWSFMRHRKVIDLYSPKASIILCGCKIDKKGKSSEWITTYEALTIAKMMNAAIYMECSSKNGLFKCLDGKEKGAFGLTYAMYCSFLMRKIPERRYETEKSLCSVM